MEIWAFGNLNTVSPTEDIAMNSKLKKLFQTKVATIIIFRCPQGKKILKLAVEFEHEVIKYKDMNLPAFWDISVCQTC